MVAGEKTQKAFYKVLQRYLMCLDMYFSTIYVHDNTNHASQEIIEKFMTTARELQSILRSLEDA